MELTSRERILRTYKHEETDRMPMVDRAWRGTIARWHREGLPENVSWSDYFKMDKIVKICPDNSPRYEVKQLEKNDRYEIATTKWGATEKHFFELDSTPEVLDFHYNTRERWEEAKVKMWADLDSRIPWDTIKKNYAKWKADGCFLQLVLWFGFDVTHSFMVGTEDTLIGMIEDKEWMMDMFDTFLSISCTLSQKLLDAGYQFDGILWYDDMGYKGSTFFSPATYRELLKPYHKRAIDWAHERGMVTELHSCGYIEPLVGDLVDMGLEMLNPLEIKAGMDPFRLKTLYGDRLAFHGGINAQLWQDEEAVLAEMNRIIPKMKENGGYIFASDHSIPNNVSFETMKKIVELARKLGTF